MSYMTPRTLYWTEDDDQGRAERHSHHHRHHHTAFIIRLLQTDVRTCAEQYKVALKLTCIAAELSATVPEIH